MVIREIETREPEVIRPDCSIIEAAQKMKQLDVGALPVCDGETLVGMVTDRDIVVRGLAGGMNPHLTTIRRIMSPSVTFCFEDQDVKEVAQMMEHEQIRRVPVLDRNRRLCGIVSLGDLAVRGRNDMMSGEILERVSEKPMA